MSKIFQFIKSLENYELAFLCTYKISDFLPTSQKIIKKEIEKRKMTIELMNKMITEKINLPFDQNNINIQCSYCKSYHYHSRTYQYSEDRMSNIFDFLFSADINEKYVIEKICSICGKNFNESRYEFIKRTKTLFN